MKLNNISIVGLIAISLLALSILNPRFSTAFAQDTAFTYQGRLNDGANQANGNYDLRFIVYDANAGGSQQGPILTNAATQVSNGLFTVTLDFGNQFPGASRWLEIAVRTNGAANFFTLNPRQALTPAPYAITAGSVVSGGLNAGTYGSAVTFNNAANNFSGAFNGNGANLTNVNATALGGLSGASFWKTNGNMGANPTNGAFLGTTDNLPLELKVNNQRVLRMEYATNGSGSSPNLTAGYSGNVVSNGFVGGVIGGGGSSGVPNRVGNNYATVVGGLGNTSSGFTSTAMGGGVIASGLAATATGYQTVASGGASFAAGSVSVASGQSSTAMGSLTTASGDYSVALGVGAKASHLGSFVWSDGGGIINQFSSTAINQFLINASGGVGIGLNNPSGALHVASSNGLPQLQITQQKSSDYARLRMNVNGWTGSPFWEMDVSPGSTPSLGFWNSTLRMNIDYSGNVSATSFNPSSDRNLKENFRPVSPREVLAKVAALPITHWNFKTDAGTTHLGPMAQDFYAAFGVGPDDKHIATVDADGVALAAIQGLNQKLEVENADLRKELDDLKQLVKSLNNRVNQEPK